MKKPVRAEPSRSMIGFLHTHPLGESHKSRSTLRQAQGERDSCGQLRFLGLYTCCQACNHPSLFDDLRDNRIRKNLRLEQEMIGFNWIQSALARIAELTSLKIGRLE